MHANFLLRPRGLNVLRPAPFFCASFWQVCIEMSIRVCAHAHTDFQSPQATVGGTGSTGKRRRCAGQQMRRTEYASAAFDGAAMLHGGHIPWWPYCTTHASAASCGELNPANGPPAAPAPLGSRPAAEAIIIWPCGYAWHTRPWLEGASDGCTADVITVNILS